MIDGAAVSPYDTFIIGCCRARIYARFDDMAVRCRTEFISAAIEDALLHYLLYDISMALHYFLGG